jgi:hypothetical protein
MTTASSATSARVLPPRARSLARRGARTAANATRGNRAAMITTVRDDDALQAAGYFYEESDDGESGARARVGGERWAEEDASAGSVARAAFATFVTLAAATMLVESADASKTGGGAGADATIAGDSPRVLATIQGFRGGGTPSRAGAEGTMARGGNAPGPRVSDAWMQYVDATAAPA